MNRFWPKQAFPLLLALAFAVSPLLSFAAKGGGSNEPAMVVLTASWCGTCREINPLVQKIIQTNPDLGLRVVTLDVDSNQAPADASVYGITVAGSDVPQVYLFSNGKTVLLFNGKDYKFGHSRQAEKEIMEQLQQNL